MIAVSATYVSMNHVHTSADQKSPPLAMNHIGYMASENKVPSFATELRTASVPIVFTGSSCREPVSNGCGFAAMSGSFYDRTGGIFLHDFCA